MRISDWSSDVCSSDLELAVERILSGKDGSRDAAIGEDASKPSLADLERKLELGSTPGVAAEEMNEKSASNGADTDIANPRGEKGAGDRKSDVQGKSVSVRVDTVGRRIIKKKKK